MARSRRLSDAERSELIARYCVGATGKELAAAYKVSIGTVRYHTVNAVRPGVAAARKQALVIKLARAMPSSRPILVPATDPTMDPGTDGPGQYTVLSPVERALLTKRWRAGATAEALAAAVAVSAATITALMDGVARSPKGEQREQARVAAQKRAQRGYPKLHPVASAVRITPVRGGGVELRVSRELYRRLGAPARVDVQRYGTRLMVRPGSRYSVVNRGMSGMPRITIGAPLRAALRLTNMGQFPARYLARSQPHISVQLQSGTRA